jgi:type IV pilus assembly protein PilY1
MKTIQHCVKSTVTALAAFIFLQFTAAAAELDLSQVPLFLGTSVPPNVFIILDDSGSMDWEILTKPHWERAAYVNNFATFTPTQTDLQYGQLTTCTNPDDDCGIWRTDGAMTLSGPDFQKPNGVVIGAKLDTLQRNYAPYQNISSCNLRGTQGCDLRSDNVHSGACLSGSTALSLASCPNTEGLDWRVRSADVNVLFYNPRQIYKPWPLSNLLDANFTKAYSNPWPGTTGHGMTVNLGTDSALGIDPTSCKNSNPTSCSSGFVYYVWDKDHDAGFTGDRPHRGKNLNFSSQPNGIVDLWDPYYKVTVTETQIKVVYITCKPNMDPATRTGDLNCSATSVNGLPSNLGGGRNLADEQTNIANWYQYYRRKSLTAKGAVSTLPQIEPNYRYGLTTLLKSTNTSGSQDLFVPLPQPDPNTGVVDFATNNNNLTAQLFKISTTNNTPLRETLYWVGKYYTHQSLPNTNTQQADPILSGCQQNFSLLVTDGYWDKTYSNFSIAIGDEDGDGHANTLADVARYFYIENLRPDLGNNLIPTSQDPLTYQHMVTFTVAFGIQGNLTDTNLDGWPDSIVTPAWLAAHNGQPWGQEASALWGDPIGATGCFDPQNSNSSLGCPQKIDDLWHAAYNGHGSYASAQSPDELTKALQAALARIRAIGTFASAAVDSSFLTVSSQIFQASFNSIDWTGKLLAYTLDASGHVPALPNWDAAVVLNTQDWNTGRQILTYDPVHGTGIPFRWDNLNTAQQGWLKGTNGTDDLGKNRLAFLRGEGAGSNPQDVVWTQTNNFRKRSSKLGDIIQSDPVYVGAPVSFSNNRNPMVYVGANDGMLHGFNATSGIEKIAYVPNKVFPNLSLLTSPNYSHQYYVDGSVTVADAYYAGAWHTVLVGGLRAGGRGFYALDVTDPANFTEDKAGSIVLWEFIDADDPDLGYTFSRPLIARMENGQWAAIFGNGYNNTEPDGTITVSATGHAVLYIVDIETGKLIKKIDTGQGTDPATGRPNGLASPAAVSINNNDTIDYIYAGDLFGNLWKFDVSKSNPDDWKVAYGKPLFKASSPTTDSNGKPLPQPITTAPVINYHPTRQGYMVYFGTGQYMEVGDANNTTIQSFYGIWDRSQVDAKSGSLSSSNPPNPSGFDRSKLFVLVTTDDVATKTRTTSATEGAIQWFEADGTTPHHLGWYTDLPDTGERQVSQASMKNNYVIFNTLIPPPVTPCGVGKGTGWLMVLNAADGSASKIAVFDLNGDSQFTKADLTSTGKVPSGVQISGGMAPAPSLLGDGQHTWVISCEVSGTCDTQPLNLPTLVGRQSWRQLR